MTRLVPIAIAVAALGCATAAMADPIQINDDGNYARLAHWEQHLDERIADGINNHSLRPYDAWRDQKRLDDIEIHLLQDHYQSGNGITDWKAHNYADQLRALGRQLGENDWNGYASGQGYGPPPPTQDEGPPPPQGYGPPPPGPSEGPPPPPPDAYYHEGQYESDCHRGNRAAGTIFGAIAGGLLGGAVGHGNGGAIAGGVILGGVAGNALAGDVDCDDQHYAFARYNEALNAPVGTEVRWEHNSRWGTFRVVAEFRDGPYLCRRFHAVSFREGQRFERDGTACREGDSYWHFR